MSGKILVTVGVVSVLALGIGFVHPSDVAAQVGAAKTDFKYRNSNGAIGAVEALQFENAFTVAPKTAFLLTDLVLTNDGDVPTSGRILGAEEGQFPPDARPRTPCFVVPAADTKVISLGTAIDFRPGRVVQVQNCSATDTELGYMIRGYNIKDKKFKPSDE